MQLKTSQLRRPVLVLALACAGGLLGPAPLRAQESLRQELGELARAVQKQLQLRDQTAIAVGLFTGPEKVPVNAGPGICQILHEELTGLGVKVDAAAPLTLKGAYEDATDRNTNRVFIELTARLEDSKGKAVVVLGARGVFGEDVVAGVMGATAALPPDGDDKERETLVVKRLDSPEVHLADNRVFAAADSPYGVEILVKEGGKYQSRTPEVREGLAYVPLKHDEVYAVRLVNNSDHDAVVTLTVDGLNAFAFSTVRDPKKNAPLLATFLIPANSTGLVRGWPIDLGKSDEFQVSDYAHSAAAELKAGTANLGVITASFAAAWPADGPAPRDEPAASSKEGNATRRGARIDAVLKSVERKFGVRRAVVTVRYSR